MSKAESIPEIPQLNRQELRVVVALSPTDAFVSPGLGNPRLFNGWFYTDKRMSIERQARAIAEDPVYGLPTLTALRGLASVRDNRGIEIRGYALRPDGGKKIMREFKTRTWDFDEVIERDEQNHGFIEAADMRLLAQAFKRPVPEHVIEREQRLR